MSKNPWIEVFSSNDYKTAHAEFVRRHNEGKKVRFTNMKIGPRSGKQKLFRVWEVPT